MVADFRILFNINYLFIFDIHRLSDNIPETGNKRIIYGTACHMKIRINRRGWIQEGDHA